MRKLNRLAKERNQPRLHYTSCSLDKLVAEVKFEYFPDLEYSVEVYFRWHDNLAFIARSEDGKKAEVVIHTVLNHTDTPPEVFKFIIKHELLHLIIPAREIRGKMRDHPPEFWRREGEISPEKTLVWCWIYDNFWSCLKRRPQLERIDVNQNWIPLWGGILRSWETCMEDLDKLNALETNGKMML